MENKYYLFLNTKKSNYFIVNFFKKEGCIVKRLRRIERKQFKNNKLNLPLIVLVKEEKKLLKLLLIVDIVSYYCMIFKSRLVNVERVKEIIVKYYKIDLSKKAGLIILLSLNNWVRCLLKILLNIKK